MTDATFEDQVLKAPLAVLVDFWAPWCGPCRKMGPIVDALAEELAKEPIKIGKMNVDENQLTPSEYGIMSIPTLLIFKDGEIKEQYSGVTSKDHIVKMLEKHF